LRLSGDFDFLALAKATPGYVGADLAALTGAAGVIAVKRIFQQLATEIPSSTSDAMLLDDAPNLPKERIVPLNSTALAPTSISNFLLSHPNPLTPSQLEPLTITLVDFQQALPEIQPTSKREGFATIPDVTWADVGALHATRDELHMAIVEPIRRPELFASVGIEAPCGVLLWGPPGCGKTLLAKAVANESGANFISVKGPELLNKVRYPIKPLSPPELTPCPFSMLGKANELFVKYSPEQELHRLVLSSSTSSTHSFHVEMIVSYVLFLINPLDRSETPCSRNRRLEWSILF